jgi:hypothetical protein
LNIFYLKRGGDSRRTNPQRGPWRNPGVLLITELNIKKFVTYIEIQNYENTNLFHPDIEVFMFWIHMLNRK